MAVLTEQTVSVEDNADAFAKDFVDEMKKIITPEDALYHNHPGIHPTPVEKRSPFWQPVDDQS